MKIRKVHVSNLLTGVAIKLAQKLAINFANYSCVKYVFLSKAFLKLVELNQQLSELDLCTRTLVLFAEKELKVRYS